MKNEEEKNMLKPSRFTIEQAEEELRENQRKWVTLINNLPGAVYRWRSVPDSYKIQLEFISEGAQQITGRPLKDLTQQNVDVIHPDDLEMVQKGVADVLENRTLGELIYRLVTPEGDIKWVLDRFCGVYSDSGVFLAVEGFFADITEQIDRQEALERALVEVERLKNRLEEENIYLQQEIQLGHDFEDIICQSKEFTRILGKVQQVASTDATVLILGETGTGKELIARAVHGVSARRNRPLVKVNCAALPSTLIESELFGHEKGAFTGALSKKIGRFELVDGGTIFLDEIGDLSLDLQAKLLRVLQEGEFERLGNPKTTTVDVRVIAATNRNLKNEIAAGTFREDLFYRLNVFPIQLPPLRKRKEDIPLLVHHFVHKYSIKVGKRIETVSQKAMERLQAYHWPGNVRELENIIERAVIVCQNSCLKAGDWLPQKGISSAPAELTTLEEAEKVHILKALEFTEWRISGAKGAAKILGMKPTTLESRMKKPGIRRPV
jgi:transcriptional regulator with GAF, ATPase, and Fis domain